MMTGEHPQGAPPPASDDVYAVFVDDLEAARALVERLLGIRLRPHEGLHHGGAYWRWGELGGDSAVIVRWNREFDGDLYAADHPGVRVLLLVEGVQQGAELERAFARSGAPVRLLWRQPWPAGG